MIRRIEEFDKYIVTAGFRNVRIENVDGLLKDVRRKLETVQVQFFDAQLIASPDHLYFAALNALKAFNSGLHRSKSLAIEALLYASAQRQIRNAVDMIGISSGTTEVAVLIVTETRHEASTALETVSGLLSGQRDDDVLELTEEKSIGIKKLFGISDVELEAKTARRAFQKDALVDLVVEHVALLATER